jgi:hypothetical protein
MKTAEKEKLKDWAIDAGVRAIKTVAQTAVAMITVGQSVSEVSWVNIASVSLVAGIASLLTSVATIDLRSEEDAETDHDDEKEEDENNG